MDALSRFRTALTDRYTLERELGTGGMATVWLAHDVRHGRKVAIKVVHPELTAVLGADRFLTEIRTTASLQHPHILPLFDSGQAEGQLYYVMPYVEGESLRDRLTRERQLPVDEAVRLAREVADALHHAHAHGVIHRDIKPENILLQGGHALVADFGIALAVQSAGGTRLTQTGLSLGTPQYMAPEQAMGERTIDARADLYALGAVAYEMLAGEPPFTGPTAQAIVAKVIASSPAPLAAQRHTVPVHVEAVVLKALEKLPADRFASAREFAEALGDARSSLAPTGAGAAARTPAGARRRAFAQSLAAAALLLAGVAAGRWLSNGAPPNTVPVARVNVRFPPEQVPRLREYPFWPMLGFTPDGSGFVYSGRGVGANSQLWLRRWGQLGATPINGTPLASAPAFSPSGDSLAFLVPPRGLRVTSLSGGRPAAIADSGVLSVTDVNGGVDWGSDGYIYVPGPDGIVRFSPDGRRREAASMLDRERGDMSHLYPHVLPGGRGALITIVSGGRISPGVSTPTATPSISQFSVGVLDFATRRATVLVPGVRGRYAPSGHLVYAHENGVLWAAPFDARAMRLTGKPVELADTVAILPNAYEFAISGTGALLYRRRALTGAQRIVWVDRDGTETGAGDDLAGGVYYNPSLSPDGRRLVFGVDGPEGIALWGRPVSGGRRQRLTFDGSSNSRVAWTPDGRAILFITDRLGSQNRLGRRAADGSGDVTMVPVPDSRPVSGVTTSPDGAWIVYRTDDQVAGNADIMAFRPGVDTVPRAIAATPAEELVPSISPDGRWIAYSSNETGRREIFVRSFPDGERPPLQVSTAGGLEPLWARDGRELFYRDGNDYMVSVAVERTDDATFSFAEPKPLFAAARYATQGFGRHYDVAPDGRRFVMIRLGEEQEPQVVVVFNFATELARRFKPE